MKIGVYAGSFDPITKGHQDIILRSLKIVDKIIVMVSSNPNKKYWFSLDERKNMIEDVLGIKKKSKNSKIEIQEFDGLLIDTVKKNNATILVRGVRTISDYDYEMTYAITNKELSEGEIETVFIPASREFMYLSSSVVREVALYQGKLDLFVDEKIKERICKRALELRR